MNTSYLLKFLIGLTLIAAFNSVQAQCPNDNIPFYFWDLSEEGEEASTTCIFGGEYASLNVIEGASYEVSTCGTSFDTQVTIYDANSGAVVGYNDDACGLQSTVNFTSASTGTVNLLVDKYNCQDEFSCAELSATLVSLSTGSPPCDNPQVPNAICQDIIVQLDATGNGSTTASAVDNGSNDDCCSSSPVPSQADFTINMADSWGDGWNGNTITILADNDPVLEDATLEDGSSGSETFSAPEGTLMTATWTAGSFTSEVSFEIIDALGAIVAGGDFGDTIDYFIPISGNSNDDACGIASLALSKTDFTCTDVGANVVTLTVTNNSANTATCSATITVEDNVAPEALCQNITVQLDDTGNASITANAVDNGSNDACGIASLVLSQTSFSCADIGANNVSLSVTDNNANVSTCSATVTVEDNVAPEALCQNVTVQLNANGNASTTANAVDNGSNDACGIASLVLSQTSFSCAEVDANDVNLTVTDVNGNVNTCSATVTVEDNVAPEALCQNTTLQLDDTGNASTTANAVDNGSNDACGIASLALSQTNFSCADIGTNTVSLSVTDNNGNIANCSASVNVEDNVGPTIICLDVVVDFNGEEMISVFIDELYDANASFDNCSPITLLTSDQTVACDQIGEVITVSVEGSDDAGNVSTCSANIIIDGLPCDWIDADGIGCSGDAEYDFTEESFTLNTTDCSAAFPYLADQVSFAYQDICGDATIIAEVTIASDNAFGGIMIREDASPGARKMAIATNTIDRMLREVRVVPNYPAFPVQSLSFDKYWLKIEKSNGFLFKGSVSTDGVNYIPFINQAIQMNSCTQVGLYVYSKDGNPASASFENVSITTALPLEGIPNTIAKSNAHIGNTITLYPNPTNSEVHLNIDSYFGERMDIRIFNANGQLMTQRVLDAVESDIETFDVSQFTPGMYWIRVVVDGKQETIKLIVD